MGSLMPTMVYAVVPPTLMILKVTTQQQLVDLCEVLNLKVEKWESPYEVGDRVIFRKKYFRTTDEYRKVTEVKFGDYAYWNSHKPDDVEIARPGKLGFDTTYIPEKFLRNYVVLMPQENFAASSDNT